MYYRKITPELLLLTDPPRRILRILTFNSLFLGEFDDQY